jgi:hypothetical protein
MEVTDRRAINILIFIFSLFVIGILTALSWLLAFANDEGGPSLIGKIGHYAFLIFRFPTHNLIWLKPELISKWFVPGLIVNVFIYSALTTFIVVKFKIRKERTA